MAGLFALLSLVKGYTPTPSVWSEFYWFLGYEHGFIKRGLVGHLFGGVFRETPVEWRRAAIVTIHIGSAIVLAGALVWWAARLMIRQQSTEGMPVLGAILALFATSQFLPTLVHNTASLDVYLYLVLLVSAALTARRLYLPAALVAAVGPFIHESFVFLWATIVILIWWPLLRSGPPEHETDPAWTVKAVATALPILATVIVLLLHNQEAAIRAVMATFVPPEVKRAVIADQFGQTTASAFQVMLGFYRDYWRNFITAAVFYLAPLGLMILVYALARFRAQFWSSSLVMAAAAMAPSAMLLFGWDLSRFLVATAFSGLVSILALETRNAAQPMRQVPALLLRSAWALALLGLFLPLVYGNFNAANVIPGPLPFGRNPLEQAVRSYVDTVYRR